MDGEAMTSRDALKFMTRESEPKEAVGGEFQEPVKERAAVTELETSAPPLEGKISEFMDSERTRSVPDAFGIQIRQFRLV
jgi:hypothetical protein